MRVLVTGATGFVGGRLVPALRDRGHEVVALVRDADRYDADVEADLLEPPVSFPDVDAAYYLVHSIRAGGDFAARDRLAARTFVDAADAAGVDRIVYLGGLGDDGDALSTHLRSRPEVEHVLAGSEAELTVLRAAIVGGEGSTSFELIEQLAARLPVTVTPEWVRTECHPIYVDDVVSYLVGALEAPETADETYEIGGPDVLTDEAMLDRTADALGRRPPLVLPVPVLSPRRSRVVSTLLSNDSARKGRPGGVGRSPTRTASA